MHLESLPQQLQLTAPFLLHALVLGPFEVIRRNGLVVSMGDFFNDDAGSVSRRETTNICSTLKWEND